MRLIVGSETLTCVELLKTKPIPVMDIAGVAMRRSPYTSIILTYTNGRARPLRCLGRFPTAKQARGAMHEIETAIVASHPDMKSLFVAS